MFVKSSHLMLLAQCIPKFQHPIVIVANGDDDWFPVDFLDDVNFCHFYGDHVLAIFIQNNITIKHSKFHHIPIGIDYHTLNWEDGSSHPWGKPNSTALEQEATLKECRARMTPLYQCDSSKVLTNFHLAMDSPPRRAHFRQPLYNLLKDKEWMMWLPSQSREEFWMSLKDAVFVLSPPGNGLDCHRTWEVLMLGKIPIVLKCDLNVVFEKLPVWEVDSWESFSKLSAIDFQRKHQEFLQAWDSYEFERLTLKWWADHIRSTVAIEE